MQIHELPTFTGTPGASDYFAVDNGSITAKVAGSDMVNPDAMTVAEATAGTSTASRIVTPKVVHDYVVQDTTHITSATKSSWATLTGNDGSINDIATYLCRTYWEPSITTTTGKLNSKEVYRQGGIVFLRINVENSSQITVGNNLYVGQLNDSSLHPLLITRSVSYSGSAVMIGQIGSSGAITCRIVGANWSAASATSITFLYMV